MHHTWGHRRRKWEESDNLKLHPYLLSNINEYEPGSETDSAVKVIRTEVYYKKGRDTSHFLIHFAKCFVKIMIILKKVGGSLMVQWLRLQAHAGVRVPILFRSAKNLAMSRNPQSMKQK